MKVAICRVTIAFMADFCTESSLVRFRPREVLKYRIISKSDSLMHTVCATNQDVRNTLDDPRAKWLSATSLPIGQEMICWP